MKRLALLALMACADSTAPVKLVCRTEWKACQTILVNGQPWLSCVVVKNCEPKR